MPMESGKDSTRSTIRDLQTERSRVLTAVLESEECKWSL